CIFFFQAEDGIRDYKVTGVQTCALPIFQTSSVHPFVRARTCDKAKAGGSIDFHDRYGCGCNRGGGTRRASPRGCPQAISADCRRSEERRVGKSVDLGGRRISKKKKERVG